MTCCKMILRKPGAGKNLFAYVNTEIAHFVQQALRAHSLYNIDVEYVVKEGQVIIVDEFTGRLMFGRRYSDGLHQAIEAKEGLNVAPESADAGHDHDPELLPHLSQAGRYDRHGQDRRRRVQEDLRHGRGGRPDE